MKKILALSLVLFLAVSCNNNAGQSTSQNSDQQQNQSSGIASTPTPTSATTPAPAGAGPFGMPISNAKSRVTKKPFGIYVSPGHSPVNPEKFTGYHTGVDFETTPEEQNADVQIYAICDGKVLEKRTASGYGGLLVQSCELNGASITVVYGHLRLSSISVATGANLAKGSQIGVLGKGYSSETDGERKHLHLGIHKGSSINIKGYVQDKSELSPWINFADYLQ